MFTSIFEKDLRLDVVFPRRACEAPRSFFKPAAHMTASFGSNFLGRCL